MNDKYVVMALNLWANVKALTPAEQPVGGMGKSVGCLLVYDSIDKLKEDYPDTPFLQIEEISKSET